MLVAAFEIEALGACRFLEGIVCVLQVGVGFADGEPAGAGVEPDVEDVGFFAEGGAAAVRAFVPAGSRSAIGGGVPGFGAFALEEVDDFAVERGVDDGLVAAFAHEDGDGHAPDALAADAPVGAGGDHVGDAFFAPGGIPDDLVDFFDGELAVGCFRAVGALHRRFERDEPLFGGAEDDGVVAAPAVRIGVLEIG